MIYKIRAVLKRKIWMEPEKSENDPLFFYYGSINDKECLDVCIVIESRGASVFRKRAAKKQRPRFEADVNLMKELINQ